MYETTFHSALLEARKAGKLTLKQLEASSGLSSRRLTRLERGIVLPTDAERAALARSLTAHRFVLWSAATRPPRLYQRLKNRGLRYLSEQQPYFPPGDVGSRARWTAAKYRYPKETKAALALLKQRHDYQEINCFAEKAPLDSADEALFLTYLLLRGAEPTMLAPYAVAPRLGHEVVCRVTREIVGFRPRPCLITDEGAYFPQVALATPRLFVVDFLRHFEERWNVVEIDGTGHDSRFDREKERSLGISVLRVSEGDVLELLRGALRGGALERAG